ncbi:MULTISPECIES: hypothetical protein [unclassified Vibrio]|uniref:hypothetical protein n=1 Tax=unclassified Vibrio TaxID=2614977 RepID=UPI00159E340D|nr:MULTISPECIES: hypothetical protein [unclassified Vibrio]NVN83243.1 hypothetical protein [Vibrio sp. Scap16]QLE91606.1 hypothetical protein FLM53_00290 [Vibrio sp. Scap24]
MSMYDLTNKQRKDRPLACLNRAVLDKIVQCPSSSTAFLTSNGRGVRKSFARDIAIVMKALVNEMCLSSNKIGVATKDGFALRSWGYIADICDFPIWRVKQCVKFAFNKGWITSKQPRETYTGKDNLQKWRGLASIKRVTDAYFHDIGIFEQYKEAKTASKRWLKTFANRIGRPVKYIQTPITLLCRRRKEAAEAKNLVPIPQ